jgi:hypothetical protein
MEKRMKRKERLKYAGGGPTRKDPNTQGPIYHGPLLINQAPSASIFNIPNRINPVQNPYSRAAVDNTQAVVPTPPPASIPVKRDIPLYKDEQNTKQLKKYFQYIENHPDERVNNPNLKLRMGLDTAGYLGAIDFLKKHGAPNVAMEGDPSIDLVNQGRAHFNPLSNTMHLFNPALNGIPDMKYGNDLVAETAHSVQMQDRGKLGLPIWAVQDWFKHPFLTRSGYDSTEYPTDGSLEYDAHTLLEPQLTNEFDSTTYNYQKAAEDSNFGSYLKRYGVNVYGNHQRGGPINHYQYGGRKMPFGGLQDALDFLYEDDEEPTSKQGQVDNTAPTTRDLGIDHRQQLQQQQQEQQDQMAVEQATLQPTNSYYALFGLTDPQAAPVQSPVQSSGKYGNQHIGHYGQQIIQDLSGALGYTPQFNSIYRDPGQQQQLVQQGVGVKNSWHLTGDAVDMQPKDWNHLSTDQQQAFRTKYDVLYHNNHYHLEPKGKRFGMGGKYRPK